MLFTKTSIIRSVQNTVETKLHSCVANYYVLNSQGLIAWKEMICLILSGYCSAELEEKTWLNKEILCLVLPPSLPPYYPETGAVLIGDIVIPFIFSLIVDPNDALFEDEIKASSNFPNVNYKSM